MQDIIIRGGMVMDGTGAEAFRADIAVKDGKITAIGDLKGMAAKKILDGEGCAVAPGFIDSHAHSDTCFLRDGSCASKLYQGITTEITGQCGSSPFPKRPDYDESWESFDAFVRAFEDGGYSMAVNQALLVGHGSLRASVVGLDDRPATQEELEKMRALLRRDLQAGAWGMSLGLEYSPGFFAPADELSSLAGVAAEFNGLVPCHMRSEGMQVREAIRELAEIGRVSGAHVHISHLKIDNFRVHGTAKEVWAEIEALRRCGIALTADIYPFTASATGLTIRCPKWSRDGGDEAVAAFLQSERRAEIIENIRGHYFNSERAETCLFSSDGGYWPEIVGKTLRFVAEEYLHTQDYAEAAAEVLVRTRGQASCIFFVMSEEDMLFFLSKDIGIGSDGYSLPVEPEKVSTNPHPRSYATIPEFFRLAREHGICSVEEAVRRVTSKPADLIGLSDRGRLKAGMIADIAVFDPDTFVPGATYLAPVAKANGMRHVLVGGEIAILDGRQTEARNGHFLRKTR
ncbi:MAG: D-aminoacylase [Clostridiales bacterium]|nr:D-aminoacylase [Clostridiales bacterium]